MDGTTGYQPDEGMRSALVKIFEISMRSRKVQDAILYGQMDHPLPNL